MKRTLLVSVAKAIAAVAFLGSLALTARADTVVLTAAGIVENPQLQGGEFIATSSTLSNASYAASVQSGSGFATFCMAYDQDFSYGQTLTYALTNSTKDSSLNTITALTKGVAYLYSQFAQGNISITTGAQDTGFQMAIWALQNSAGNPGIASLGVAIPNTNAAYYATYYLNLAEAQFGGTLVSAQAAAGANNFGVQVLLTGYGTYNSSDGTFSIPNSYGGQGAAQGYSQPQLYYSRVPDAGSTLTLLGLSLLGIVGFRRKFGSAR
jgi:hypothetical protein